MKFRITFLLAQFNLILVTSVQIKPSQIIRIKLLSRNSLAIWFIATVTHTYSYQLIAIDCK